MSSAPQPSLPVSRGSAVDSELEVLMRAHPDRTRELLYGLYNIPVPGAGRSSSPEAPQQPGPPKGALGRTHYQDTYVTKGARKRSSKRPTQAMGPGAAGYRATAMNFDTSQRVDYVPKDLLEARTEPVKKPGGGSGDSGSWLWRDQSGGEPQATVYQEEYRERPLGPLERSRPEAVGGRVMVANGEFYGETTAQADFKGWSSGRNTISYGEMPEFIGSVLNPGTKRDFQTVNQFTYKGPRGVPAAPAAPAVGSLTLDGAMDFSTVNRDTYLPLPAGARRPPPARATNDVVLERKLPMHSVTQTRADFKAHNPREYRRSEAAQPPEETLDLRFDRNGYWNTEQRQEFRGVDVRQHPVPASFKKDPSQYTAPEGHMLTESTSHEHFRPKDIKEAFRERVKPPVASSRFAGKFASETTSAEANRQVEGHATSPRLRHGDFHLGYQHVPKFDRLEGESETRASFVPKPFAPTQSFKPTVTAAAPDSDGERDFATVHRTAYRPPRFHLTRDQAAAIKAELRRLEVAAVRGTGRGPLPGIVEG